MRKLASSNTIQLPVSLLKRLGVLRLGNTVGSLLGMPPAHVGILAALTGLGVAMNTAAWGVVVWLFPKNSPAAILHYTADLGIDFVGSGTQIYTLPRLGAFILLFNLVIGLAVSRADQRPAWVLWTAAPVVQLILLTATMLIWNANT